MFTSVTFFTACLTLLSTFYAATAADCIFDVVTDNPNFSNLVFDINGEFIDPIDSTTRNILIKEGDKFWIACPGGSFQPHGIVSDGEQAICIGDTTISIHEEEFDFNSIKCFLDSYDRPYLLALGPYDTCESSGSIVEIGYGYGDNGDDNVVVVYAACVTTKSSVSLYVKYVITQWADKLINHQPVTTPVGLDSSILEFYEENHIQGILKNLGYDGTISLVEGYLAANDDFFYPFERDATSCYTNIAPQWNSIKEGNWLSLEIGVRKVVTDGFHEDLLTYAGTLGISSIEDKNSEQLVDLYLNNPKVPVPKWFWKLIYSRSEGTANIFFTYNNPFITDRAAVDEEFLHGICTHDELQNIEWLPLIDNEHLELGLTYACLVSSVLDVTIYEIIINIFTHGNASSIYKPSLYVPNVIG